MSKKIIIFGALSIIITALFSFTYATQAQTSIIDSQSPKYATGDYTLNDIVIIAIGASRWILGIVGSLALIMFIYGGFTLLISTGSSDKIGQAKKIIVAASIGLLIVFSSYLIIKFVLYTLGMDWNGKVEKMKTTSSLETLAVLTLK